jgi:enoyl-CoA hydratase/carnithine racemase
MGSVQYALDGPIATIVIAGDDERNLLDSDMAAEFSRCLTDYDGDSAARVCLIRGSGARNFCGGSTGNGVTAAANLFHHQSPRRIGARGLRPDVVRSRKPVIAAVHGSCLDEGLVLFGRATDIRIAGNGASFGFPGVRTGNAGDLAVRSNLDRQIPFTVLRWLIVVGQVVNAAEALRVGLVNEVVPDAELLARARQVAEMISELAPLALRAEKETILNTQGTSIPEAFLYSAAVGLINRLGPDVAEGVAAFTEKRKPDFRGIA